MIKNVRNFEYKGYRCMITEDFVEKNLRAVADFITGKEMRMIK
jgi:hypothetical protein